MQHGNYFFLLKHCSNGHPGMHKGMILYTCIFYIGFRVQGIGFRVQGIGYRV